MTTNTTNNQAPRKLTRMITMLALVAAILASLMAITPTADAHPGRVAHLTATAGCSTYLWDQPNGQQSHIYDFQQQKTPVTLFGGSGWYTFTVSCDGGIPVTVTIYNLELQVEVDPYNPFQPTVQFDPEVFPIGPLCTSCPNPYVIDFGDGPIRFGSEVNWDTFRQLADEHRFAEDVDVNRIAELAGEGLVQIATMALPNHEGVGAMAYSTGEYEG